MGIWGKNGKLVSVECEKRSLGVGQASLSKGRWPEGPEGGVEHRQIF